MDARPAARVQLAVALIALSAAWNAGNVGPVASEIGADLDVSLASVGLLSGTLYFGATVVGLLVAAPLGKRIGLRQGLWLACLLLVAGNVVIALSPAFAGVAVGRALPGVGFALVNVFGAVHAQQAGGVRLIGVFGASIQLGIAGALAVGSGLAALGVDWRVGFAISALLGLAALVAIPPREVDPAAPAAPAPAPAGAGFLRVAVRHARVYRLALLFIAIYGVPMVLGAWLVEYLVRDGGLSTALAGSLAFLLFALSAAARILGASLQRRGLPHVALTGSLALAAAGMAAVAVAPSMPIALVAVIALALGFAIPYATMLTEAQQLYPAAPSEPVALMALASLIVPIAVIPPIGDALESGGGEPALLLLAALLAGATVLNLRGAGRPLTAPVPPGGGPGAAI